VPPPALVPPPADVPPEVDKLRVQVRAFLAKELAAGRFTPRCDAWLAGWNPEFSRALARHGWVGMTFPREYGGHGRSTLERFAVTEELLAAGAPVAAHWIADRQMGPSLLRFGTEAQKERFLPAIARGECFFGIGMSEPDSGSDLASVRTRASRVDTGWVLDGTKVWTSGAHHAHALVVLARTEPVDPGDRHAGLSQFIVTTDSAGLAVNPIRLLTGEHHFNEVVFDGVEVPDDMVLGTIGAGWHQVTSELAFERSGPERILSTYPLLAHVVSVVRADTADVHHIQIGALLARLWTLRQMSLAVAGQLGGGVAVDVPAALVKDLGTRFESEVIELARMVLDVEPDATSDDRGARLLAQAELHAPGFTIRGGTNEILRGVVARAVGLR
jgi:alkylation response protein AidB-like acyl-CoA dehydrogenase